MINRNKKTLLCCLRIKSAGLLIGLIDLFLHLILLLALCTAITKPSVYDYYIKQLSKEYLNQQQQQQQLQLQQDDQSLPSSSIKFISLSNDIDFKADNTNGNNNLVPISNANDYLFFNNIHVSNTKQDRTIAFMVTLSTALITTMYVYGIFKNKANYLLPYFCLKVFHLVITVLTTLGFYSCLPNVKLWIKMHNYFPYKEELLSMDKQSLELIVFATLLLITLFKIYIVLLIWNCYRYIISRNTTALLPTTTTTSTAILSPTSTGGDLAVYYKADDEHLLTSQSASSLLPPKYDEVIKKKAALEATTTTTTTTTEGEVEATTSNISTNNNSDDSTPPPYVIIQTK